jgi:cbb3-type cytochrome oxidase subunit 3
MNKTRPYFFVVTSLFLLFIPAILFAIPTEESLIEAWESFQKRDSKTLIFEKISKNHYRFKTERFPFDGELKILNVTVDKQTSSFEGGFILGVVEIELINLPKDFLEKYSYSYSAWIQDNILYYDTEEEKWLSDDEYYGRMKEKIPTSFFLDILNYLPFLFLLFIIFILIIAFNIQKKNKRYLDYAHDLSEKQMQLIEKSLKMEQKSNKLLSEILKELRKKKK